MTKEKIAKVNRDEAMLLLIDVQERLLPVMSEAAALEAKLGTLIQGCTLFDVPTLVTQQYTKGLGPTVPSLQNVLGDAEVVEKHTFSACGEPAFLEALARMGRKTILLTGIESHICVLQTALDLLERGYEIFLVYDGIDSRSPQDKKFASKRMVREGAIFTTCESVLFELCGDAKGPGFKELSALVK